MHSLNAPVPAVIAERRDDLVDQLSTFERHREHLTLVVKRFGERSPGALVHLEHQLEDILTRWGPIEARITGVDAFVDPPGGPAPVVYFAVDSPGLTSLHMELVDRFGMADPTIEGDRYVPHITLARGGSRVGLSEVTGHPIEPIDWVIDELVLWTARYDRPITHLQLPTSR